MNELSSCEFEQVEIGLTFQKHFKPRNSRKCISTLNGSPMLRRLIDCSRIRWQSVPWCLRLPTHTLSLNYGMKVRPCQNFRRSVQGRSKVSRFIEWIWLRVDGVHLKSDTWRMFSRSWTIPRTSQTNDCGYSLKVWWNVNGLEYSSHFICLHFQLQSGSLSRNGWLSGNVNFNTDAG